MDGVQGHCPIGRRLFQHLLVLATFETVLRKTFYLLQSPDHLLHLVNGVCVHKMCQAESPAQVWRYTEILKVHTMGVRKARQLDEQ